MPFAYGTEGQLAFFLAADDARAHPERLFCRVEYLVRVRCLAHRFGHHCCLQVGAEGVQVHAELGQDGGKFVDARLRYGAMFVNVFTEAADFHLLEFRNQNLARFNLRFVRSCRHFGRICAGRRIFEGCDKQYAAVTPDIDGSLELVIHFHPRFHRQLPPMHCL